MKHIFDGDNKTQEFAKSLVTDTLKKWPKQGLGQRAVVFALIGDLGSGKTTFTQGFAKALNIKERVVSPTFVIEKVYKIQGNKNFKHLIHIDAYRLDNEKELLSLGWEELIKNPQNIILVEWADKIEKILPKDATILNFKYLDENKREITTG